MTTNISRRIFVVATLSNAAGCPLSARAQERVRRIGVLSAFTEGDAEAAANLVAFRQALQRLGWVVGRNVSIDYRWTAGAAEPARKYAAELVALKPDAVLATGGSMVGPLQQISGTIPIVFVQITDPVGGGFVDSLARPGRNATGFTVGEFSIGAKWLELLRQMSPSLRRIAVLRDPVNPSGIGLYGAVLSAAPSVGIEVVPISLRDAGEIERGMTAFADRGTGGLIVTPSGLAIVHRELIIALATKHSLPAIYGFRFFVNDGGLISYGPDALDQFIRAAGYIDRILKGESPADLPVQAPTKYTLAINAKTAQVLKLTVPQSLLATADEVIE